EGAGGLVGEDEPALADERAAPPPTAPPGHAGPRPAPCGHPPAPRCAGPRAAAFAPDVHVADLTRLRVEPAADGSITLTVLP
ncbi:hypothetical protein ACWCQ0_53050, partial [Streptomyces massasporeus]